MDFQLKKNFLDAVQNMGHPAQKSLNEARIRFQKGSIEQMNIDLVNKKIFATPWGNQSKRLSKKGCRHRHK